MGGLRAGGAELCHATYLCRVLEACRGSQTRDPSIPQGTPLRMPCSIDAINTHHANSLVHMGLRPNVDLCTLSVLGCM